MSSTARRVAIIGGGVTGLTTAVLLVEQGVEVDLFESRDGAGGLAGSFVRGDYIFDFGPHEFCTDNPDLIALTKRICGEKLITLDKRAAQHFCGRLVRFPFQTVDVLRNVPFGLGLRAFAGIVWAKMRNVFRKGADVSYEDWTRSRFGNALYDSYFGPYTQKVWGISPSLLDPRTGSQRISVDSLWDLVKKTLRYQYLGRDDYKRTHSAFKHQFYYVHKGIGTLHSQLENRLRELGGRVHFSKRLVATDIESGSIQALRFEDGDCFRDFDDVVSTIPLPDLRTMIHGPNSASESSLSFRGMVFVFAQIARPKVTDFHWVYFSDPEIEFQRMTEFAHFEAGMSPEGCTGLTLEISANPGDAFWRMTDDELVDLCRRRLNKLGLVKDSEFTHADVVRVRHAYPIQTIGFAEEAEAQVRQLKEAARNLVTLGRQGLFRYCNMNECMEMAMDVAPRIASGEPAVCFDEGSTWQGVGLTDRYDEPPEAP